ncbi:hypothetical protein DUI87_12581 [Hirundo rustica rustica]|uniref:Fibrinogen C-terminal domain-containing protein n=1 Tax=Hirundo rustica rustica TaxID=333673 RepID=A0A3M0KCC8_HIRRU|nr:hypothetical protein DUI87_12581 [Hirundo rustica rustica]
MATQGLCLLLLTCLLALAASFPDVDIRNLYLLNGTMDDIMNAPPEPSPLGTESSSELTGSPKKGQFGLTGSKTKPRVLWAMCSSLEKKGLKMLTVCFEDMENNSHLWNLQDDGDGHVRRARDIAHHAPPSHASGWPKDCSEIPRGSHSGVYIIQPKGLHHLVVYCEMNVTHGGWTVIQRNQRDTPVTWAESWSTYKFGFGNVRTEYWLGTEYIHQIAKQKVYQVRFVIQDSADNFNFADYNLFSVEDESHGYRLRLGSYNGTAGDAMTSDNPNNMHDNMKFSTKDQDQDTYSKNCAYSYEGGWWYSSCYSVRLNYKGGMTWGNLCKGNCKSSLILIKPASYC